MQEALNHNSIVILLGGVAFLIFGLSAASEALQKLAANQIRTVLTRLNEKSLIGVIVGIALTLLMQSSGAVTATLVNLGSARVLTLPQVMGVLIGSAIGTTLTVQLLSLHVSDWGLPLFLVGFTVQFLTKRQKIKDSFGLIMALGLLFFGLELIGIGSGALIGIEGLSDGFRYLNRNPLVAVFVAAALTSVFHSSTATLGILMGLAAGGVMTVSEAVWWVYGANIGTTTTAIVASMKGDYVGRRIAWANLFYRVATVVIFLPFAGPCLKILIDVLPSPSSRIAFFYTIMNVVSAAIFFPLRDSGVKFIERLVQPAENEKEFAVRFLKRSTYESFTLALSHAKREILEMGDIVYLMTESSLTHFRQEDEELLTKTKECDDRVDMLLKEIKHFLIRVSGLAPEGLNQSVMDLISFGSDLEGAADIIDHHILGLARKMHKHKLEFSADAWEELGEIHQGVMRMTSLVLTCFQMEDPKLAEQVIDLKHDLRDVEQRAREAHIGRLSKGVKESLGTSAIFLETLTSYLQLAELLSRHAYRIRNHSGSSQGVTGNRA